MSATHTSSEPVSTTEPSDPYVVTPEVNPTSDTLPTEGPTTSDDKEDIEKRLRIDGEAYKSLTKPDPHWVTTFNPAEVRGHRWRSDFLYSDRERYFEMLAEINKGRQNGPVWEHSEIRTYGQRKDLVGIIGNMLNMTALQIDEATARATNVDGEKFGQRLELLVFCTCAYVVHRDETGYAKDRHYHPNREENDKLFEEVAEILELPQFRIDNVCRMFDQKFTEELPPVEFDERKPDWKPNENIDAESPKSVSPDECVGHRWRGGI